MNDDQAYREGVLTFLLIDSRLATIEEIVAHRTAFQSRDDQKEIRDGTERAIRDLAGMGIVNVAGGSVYASRAARETARLVEGPDPVIPAW